MCAVFLPIHPSLPISFLGIASFILTHFPYSHNSRFLPDKETGKPTGYPLTYLPYEFRNAPNVLVAECASALLTSSSAHSCNPSVLFLPGYFFTCIRIQFPLYFINPFSQCDNHRIPMLDLIVLSCQCAHHFLHNIHILFFLLIVYAWGADPLHDLHSADCIALFHKSGLVFCHHISLQIFRMMQIEGVIEKHPIRSLFHLL